jgi:DNA-binding MarR family transcriptional regulator
MDDRTALESAVVADVQALSAESDQIGRVFAGVHELSANDFRALVHVMVADNAGTPLTAGELRSRMGLSGAAITYLVERMIASGHLRRESDPADRRKVILRYAQRGIEVGRAFFTPLADHTHRALADLPDDDLAAAHRVFTAVLAAMGGFRTDLSAPPG